MLIIDHDNIGPDEVRDVIENQHYPNHCIAPTVASVETREVEWDDSHPLNGRATWRDAFRALFGKT